MLKEFGGHFRDEFLPIVIAGSLGCSIPGEA